MRATLVADFILALANETGLNGVDALKLEKLLYLIQGHSLEKTGRPLISDPFVAFKNGPVVQEVEERYRGTKGNLKSNKHLESINITSEDAELIIDVVTEFNDKTAIALTRMIHKEDNPWSKAWNNHANATIHVNDIKDYYSKEENRVFGINDILEKMAVEKVEVENMDGYIVLPNIDLVED